MQDRKNIVFGKLLWKQMVLFGSCDFFLKNGANFFLKNAPEYINPSGHFVIILWQFLKL